MDKEQKILAIIGAGPKGIATAVKAKVLSELGIAVDKVILIEKFNVAAHWSGQYGYTNGEMKLGTSPEKDVVFPIETDVGDEALNSKIRQRLLFFSWSSYLVNVGKYSEWIDRGRPSPHHKQWAEYLNWVGSHLAPEVEIITAEVKNVELDNNHQQWRLTLGQGDLLKTISADRLMITGPGGVKKDFIHAVGSEESDRVFDLKTFWTLIRKGQFPNSGRLAIVGAGENAASALLALVQENLNLEIELISPKGFISTRAENFYENQFYSAPERQGWNKLSFKDKIDFIARTDLGVFSTQAMGILNDQKQHRIIPGRVFKIKESANQVQLSLAYQNQDNHRIYDYVLLASGFDQISFLRKIMSTETLSALEAKLGYDLTDENISLNITRDLSVEGLSPQLHLPMLAGLTQGPGFANLSCLGRLSDRLLLPMEREQASLFANTDQQESISVMEKKI